MGWLNRFLSGERSERITSSELTEILVAAIATSTDRLIARLKSADLAQIALDRADSCEFAAECLFLQAFAMDWIIAAQFGSWSDLIREKVAYRLFKLMEDQGVSPEAETDFHEVRVARFIEYAEALRPAGGFVRFERLGAVAWENILGRREPLITIELELVARVSAMWKTYGGIGAKLTVVQ